VSDNPVTVTNTDGGHVWTLDELRALLAISRAYGGYPQSDCRHCGRWIAFLNKDGQGPSRLWFHIGADGGVPVAGCYAASFRSDQGWDESLADRKRSRATPPKGFNMADALEALDTHPDEEA
jgi:hypothetical protein